MQKFSRLLIASITALSLLTGASLSQDTQPSFKFNLFEIDGLVISDTYTFDQDYGAEQGMPVPSLSAFTLPAKIK